MLLLTKMSVRVKIGKNKYITFESHDDYDFVEGLEKGISIFIIKYLHSEDDENYEKEEYIFLGVLFLADYLKNLSSIKNIKFFVEDEEDFGKRYPALGEFFLPIRSSIYTKFFNHLRSDFSRKKFKYVKRKIESLISLRSMI